jgi:hypothetical protein
MAIDGGRWRGSRPFGHRRPLTFRLRRKSPQQRRPDHRRLARARRGVSRRPCVVVQRTLTSDVWAYRWGPFALSTLERHVSQSFTQPSRDRSDRKAKRFIYVRVVAELATGRREKAWSVTGGDRPVGTLFENPARTLRHDVRASRRGKAGGALGCVARGVVERVPGSARAGNRQGERCHHRRHGHVKRPR